MLQHRVISGTAMQVGQCLAALPPQSSRLDSQQAHLKALQCLQACARQQQGQQLLYQMDRVMRSHALWSSTL